MTLRSTLVLLTVVLAASCSRSKSERDSKIGRTTYDGTENMEPASRPLPLTEQSPLANDSALKAAPEPGSELAPDAGIAANDGGPSDSGTGDSGVSASAKTEPDVIYVPTPQPVVDKMLELARVTKDDLVYDLGCGDGRIVVTAAKRYGARAVGFDIDPVRVTEAKRNVEKNGVGHLVRIEQKDIFTVDLRPATVVTLYLLPELNDRLMPQLELLAPGSRVVSHDFDITGVKPVTHVSLRGSSADREHEVYFYTVPFEREKTLNLPKPVVAPPNVP